MRSTQDSEQAKMQTGKRGMERGERGRARERCVYG